MFTPERRTSPSRVGLGAPRKAPMPARQWTDAPPKLNFGSASRSPSPPSVRGAGVNNGCAIRSSLPSSVRGAGATGVNYGKADRSPSPPERIANLRKNSVSPVRGAGFEYLQPAPAKEEPAARGRTKYIDVMRRREASLTRTVTGFAQPMTEEPIFAPALQARPSAAPVSAPAGLPTRPTANSAQAYMEQPKFNMLMAVKKNPRVIAFLDILKSQQEYGAKMSEGQFVEVFKQIFPSEMAAGVSAIRSLYREHLQSM